MLISSLFSCLFLCFLYFSRLSPDRQLPRSRDAVDLYLPCMSIDLAVRCTPRVDVLLDTSGRGLSASVHVAIQGTAVLVTVSDWSGDFACFEWPIFPFVRPIPSSGDTIGRGGA